MLSREEIIVKYVKEKGYRPCLISENNGRKSFINFDNNYTYERIIVKNPFAQLGVSANNLFIIETEIQKFNDVPCVYDSNKKKYYYIFKRPLGKIKTAFSKEINGDIFHCGMNGFPLPRINPGITFVEELKDYMSLKSPLPLLLEETVDELKEIDQQLQEQTKSINAGVIDNEKRVRQITDTQRHRR